MKRRTYVVASADPPRRTAWARFVGASAKRVLTCAGPGRDCPLVSGETRCRLLDVADVAVYDRACADPQFLARLVRAYPRLGIAVAHGGTDGEHTPAVTRFTVPTSFCHEVLGGF